MLDLDLIVEELANHWYEKPELILQTSSSVVTIFEKEVKKYRHKDSFDPRQIQKSDRILKKQNIQFKKSIVETNAFALDVVSMRRFQHADCVASKYLKLNSRHILQIYRKIERLSADYQIVPFDRLSFKLGISENMNRQCQWVESSMPAVLVEKVHDYFMRGPEIVENYLDYSKKTTIRLCHGDLHLGNIFVRGHRTYVLDPAENDIRFCLVPVWVEYASLTASLLVLGRDDLIDELLVRVGKDYSDFNLQLFELWVTIKILVRLRFETQFVALNDTVTESGLMNWRLEAIAQGNERLSVWLNRVAYSRGANAPIASPTKCSVEILRIANQIIENRRNELSAKSNVYVAVSIALVAGNIAFLDQNTASFSLVNVLLLFSAALSLFSIWSFLGMVRSLSGRSRAPKSRGKLLFFGWWAKSDWKDIAQKLDYMTELDFANELAVQNRALSKNIRFRYQAQSRSTKTLSLAFLVFILGISMQVLGIDGAKLREIYEMTSMSGTTNTSIQRNVP